MSKVSTCWWGDNAWKKRLLKSADLRSQMWHWAFCPPVGHRQVQHNFPWIGLFSRNSRKFVLLKVVHTLVSSVSEPSCKSSQQRPLMEDGKGRAKGKGLPWCLGSSLGTDSWTSTQINCSPWGTPHAWGQLGLGGSLQRLWPSPPQMGHRMATPACQCPTLPACPAQSLAFWFSQFPGNHNLWCLEGRARLCTSLCNKHLENLRWFWCSRMAAAESLPPALLREQCHLLVTTQQLLGRTGRPRTPGTMRVPSSRLPVPPGAHQTDGFLGWWWTTSAPCLFLGLGAQRGACNGINSLWNNNWKASNSLWAP